MPASPPRWGQSQVVGSSIDDRIRSVNDVRKKSIAAKMEREESKESKEKKEEKV